LESQVDGLRQEVNRERDEQRGDTKALVGRVEELSERVGDVYRVLLLAVLPLAGGLFLAVVAFLLGR